MRLALVLVALLLPGCAMLPQKAADAECGSGAQSWLLLVTQTPGFVPPDQQPLGVERLDRDGTFTLVRGHYNREGEGFSPPPAGYQNMTEADARYVVSQGMGSFPANATLTLAFRTKLAPDQVRQACVGVAALVAALLTERKDVAIQDCGGHHLRASLADGDHEADVNCNGEGPVSRSVYEAWRAVSDHALQQAAPSKMRVLLVRSNFTLSGNAKPMEARMGGHCAPVSVGSDAITLRIYGDEALSATGVVVRTFEAHGDIVTVSADATGATFLRPGDEAALNAPLPPYAPILRVRLAEAGFLVDNATGPAWSRTLTYNATSSDATGTVVDHLEMRDAGKLAVRLAPLAYCA